MRIFDGLPTDPIRAVNLRHMRSLPKCSSSFRTGSSGIDIGAGVVGGKGVSLTRQDFRHHLLVAGATGTGKTKLLEHICRRIIVHRSLSAQNGGLIVVDPHASFAGDLIRYMALCNLDVPLVVIDPDGPDVVAFDPAIGSDDDHANRLGTWIAHLWERQGNSEAPRLSGGLAKVIQTIRDAEVTLAEVYDLLNPLSGDADVRRGVVMRIKDAGLRRQWEKHLDSTERLFDFEMGSTQRAFAPLVDAYQQRLICGQGASFRFERALDGAWIVMIIGGRSRGTLSSMTLMLDSLWHAAMNRMAPAPPMHLVLDEFAEVLSPAVVPLLPQARKFGLSVTLGMQSPSDLSAYGPFGRQVVNGVIHSARSKITFQLDGAGARLLAGPLRVDASKIERLERRHAIVRTLSDDRPRRFVTDDVPDFQPDARLVRAYLTARSRPWRDRFLWERSVAAARYEDRRLTLAGERGVQENDEPDEFGIFSAPRSVA